MQRVLAERRVQEQLHLAGDDAVEEVGPPLVHLEDPSARHAPRPEVLRRALRCEDVEAEFVEAPRDRHHVRLVLVVHRDRDGPLGRQPLIGRDLGLGERHPEAVRVPHDLPGGAHLRPEHRVRVGDLVEGEHGLLHRDLVRHEFIPEAEVRELHPREDAGGHPGQRNPRRLAHEGHGPARPRVDLEHVDRLPVDRELDVDESPDIECEREGARETPHGLHVDIPQQIGGQDAGRVARMDASVLNVLHDPADHYRLPVAHRVDVRLERVFEEPVQEHRVLRRGLYGAGEVLPQRGRVVHDLHRPAAQHVAGPDEDRIPDLLRDLQRLVDARRGPARRHRHAEFAAQFVEPAPVLRAVDRFDARPEDGDA